MAILETTTTTKVHLSLADIVTKYGSNTGKERGYSSIIVVNDDDDNNNDDNNNNMEMEMMAIMMRVERVTTMMTVETSITNRMMMTAGEW